MSLATLKKQYLIKFYTEENFCNIRCELIIYNMRHDHLKMIIYNMLQSEKYIEIY